MRDRRSNAASRSDCHAREGGHPVRRSFRDSVAGALEYWVPAFAGTTIVIGLLAVQPTHAQTPDKGFAGLGADAGGYAQVLPGKQLKFPADHGAHPEYRIEWWYFTANLKDADGATYGVQWTLFRQANKPNDVESGWSSRQLFMAHAAVTSRDTHRFAERFARGGVGQAGVEAAPFKAWIDDWQLRSLESDARLAPLEVRASAKDFSYALRLDSDRGVVLQGEGGYSRKSEQGQASYYYSQPFLQVSGSLVIDGRTIAVTGQGWIDREWSSQPLASNQTGWDWFSLHLASGEKLMLFRLRHADGRHFLSGNWIVADGRSQILEPKDIVITPGATTRVAGRDLPTAWKLSVPSRGLEVSTAPLNPQSWMDARFKYWEGPVRLSGSHSGEGYLEMTGY
jgi:predicted secreted hydrolase